MDDVWHDYSGDLVISANGDLLTATSVDESRQRVLRRLYTNLQDYIWNPTYGAGLPAKIGDPFDVATISAIVTAQMYLEESVVRNPPPVIQVSSFPNGMFVDIRYTEADSGLPTTLAFPVTQQGLNG